MWYPVPQAVALRWHACYLASLIGRAIQSSQRTWSRLPGWSMNGGEMSACRACGTEIDRAGSFCPKCGAALEPATEAISDRPVPVSSVSQSSRMVWVLPTIVAGLLLTVGGWFLFLRDGGGADDVTAGDDGAGPVVSSTTSGDIASPTSVITASGGAIEIDGARVLFPPGAVAKDVEVAVVLMDPDVAELPGKSMIDVGPAISVDLGGSGLLAPVEISLALAPGAADVNTSAVVFGQRSGSDWEFVKADYDPASGMVMGTVDHFSWWNPLSWCYSCFFDELSQTVGELVGNRIDPPTCSGQAPDWVDSFVTENIASAPFVGCADAEGDVAVVRLANNRPYGVIVTSPVPFAWGAVDHPLPINDLAHEAFGRNAFGFEDWLYIPATSYAYVGIAEPDESTFVDLEAGPRAFTAVVDAMLLALDEYGGVALESDSAAELATGVAIECFGLSVINEPAPESVADVAGMVETLGSCLTDLSIHDTGELLGTFTISREELTSLVLAKGFFAGLDAARYGGQLGDLFTDWLVDRQYGLPTVGFTARAPGEEPPTLDELADAEIPAMCGHDATQLVGGQDVTLGTYDGEFVLLDELGSGKQSWATFSSPDGPLTVVVARCNAGGVGWPNPIMFFGPGPEFYDSSFLDDYNWESIGLYAPARDGVEAIRETGIG